MKMLMKTEWKIKMQIKIKIKTKNTKQNVNDDRKTQMQMQIEIKVAEPPRIPYDLDCEQSLVFFARLLHAKPKPRAPVIITSWFGIALDEIRTRRILREKADCKQSRDNFPRPNCDGHGKADNKRQTFTNTNTRRVKIQTGDMGPPLPGRASKYVGAYFRNW